DLAIQQELLGRQAQKLGKATMEMEWAQMHHLGDFHQRWAAAEMLLHELHRGNQASQLLIRMEILRLNRAPGLHVRLQAEECKRPFAKSRVMFVGHEAEDPHVAVRVGNL